MAVIYYPTNSEVLRVTVNSGSNAITETHINVAPGKYLVFTEAGEFTASYVESSSYSITSSYALNGGNSNATLTTGSSYPITSSWSNNSLSSSYISQSNAKIESGSLYVLSNLGDWWKVSIYDDGTGNATIQLDNP